jgi:hypothetical protein
VNLPAADDLFRRTGEDPPKVRAVPDTPDTEPEPAPTAKRGPSGRVKHDEKMTVYITSDELLEIEHARLALRRAHGLGVDRGRLVRAAVAIALADLEANGEDSVLVQRLSDRAAG